MVSPQCLQDGDQSVGVPSVCVYAGPSLGEDGDWVEDEELFREDRVLLNQEFLAA